MSQRTLPVYLSDEECKAAARKLAETLWEKEQKEAEAKDSAATYRDAIKTMAETISELKTVVRSGVEHRLVDCEDRKNMAAGTTEIYRLDTGEMVESRPLSALERQADMFPRNKVVVVTSESLWGGKKGKADS